MNYRLGFGVIVATMLAGVSVAHAQPAEVSAMGSEDDASLTLTMLDSLITSDPLVWCRIDVSVDNEMVAFTEGDTITVSLIEDDAIANDLVWSTEVVLTADEAGEPSFERSFDCGAQGKRDGIGQLEFFAQVEVDKDLCGITCLNDNPTTTNIDVTGVDDDEQEEDDDPSMAMPADLEAPKELVAADADHVRVTLPGPGSIEASLEFMVECGDVAVEIVDEDGTTVSETEANDAGATAIADALGAGAYFIVTQPADAGDLNFYDISVTRVVDEDPGDDTGDSGGADGTGDDADTGSNDGDGPDDGADDGADDGGPGGDGNDDGDGDGDGTGGSDEGGAGAAGEEDGCGCSQTSGRTGPAWLSAMLMGLLLVRRRRS